MSLQAGAYAYHQSKYHCVAASWNQYGRHAGTKRTRWPARRRRPAAARSAHGKVGAAGADPRPGRARVRCRGGRQAGAGSIATRARSAPGASCSMSASCSTQRTQPGLRRRRRTTTRESKCSMPWRPSGRRRLDRNAGAHRTRWPEVDVGQLQRVARTARSAPPAQIHDQGKRGREAVAAVRPAPARSPRGRAAHDQVASGKAVAKCGIM